eukprot:5083477-Pleurochrysis_carterae.AAC.2
MHCSTTTVSVWCAPMASRSPGSVPTCCCTMASSFVAGDVVRSEAALAECSLDGRADAARR